MSDFINTNATDIDPNQYFDWLKSKKHKTTDESLSRFYENCMYLLNKYKVTNQVSAMRKLLFQIEVVERERKLIELGVTTFVYKDDVEEYIDNVAKNVVKIIDLESYERDIPDEIVEVVAKTRNVFDKFYVVFTDYTGKVERQVEEERKRKDPIIFGTFQRESERVICDRFYYLGDWVDEYCDLTLDKMVSEYNTTKKRNIAITVSTPEDIESLRQTINSLTTVGFGINERLVVNTGASVKKSFFSKIKSILKG